MNKADYDRLKENGALSEHYGYHEVTISCGSCATQWMRGRREGRRVTLADRQDALDHVLTQHPDAYRAAPAHV